jgi:hypothetical protein
MKVNLIDSFRDFTEYRAWIAKAYEGLSSLNAWHKHDFSKREFTRMGRAVRTWYGPGVTYEDLAGGIDQYARPELLGNLLEKVKANVSAETLAKVPSKRMRFNDMGLGVFSFDRAAMGMYRVKELYSPSLGRRVDEREAGMVSGRLVLLADGSPLEERWELRPDGSPRARTSTKRLFAYFPKVSRPGRTVSIVVRAGGHAGIRAENFLFCGLAAVVVAQLLEQAGIRTTIDVLVGSITRHQSTRNPIEFNGCLVPAKGTEQALDANLVAMVTSDPRFFRFEGFKGIIAAHDHFGRKTPDQLGSPAMKNEVEAIMSLKRPTAKVVCISECFSEVDAVRVIEESVKEVTSMGGGLNEGASAAHETKQP